MGIGILKLLTGGCAGILYIVDIILIACGNLKPAHGVYEDQPQEQIREIPTKPVQTNEDIMKSLEKLADLRDKGIISEREFDDKKSKLLEHIK